jgi:hypothetical protein
MGKEIFGARWMAIWASLKGKLLVNHEKMLLQYYFALKFLRGSGHEDSA